MSNIQSNTYDEVPYQSMPFAQSSPEALKTIGKLFDFDSPNIENCRVLELGCAEGGNIIPHAARYPKAQFVGVDLSKNQIESGNLHVKELKLKNIELKNCSITDIDDRLGKFDYIICHGVISWVEEPIRKKILEVASANLSANGIAYISYNTLPGWNMVRTVRDMMLYHTKDFTSPREKIEQARLILDFVKESLTNQDTPYANILRQEAELLSGQSDYYLRHDHLEENNKQFYFTEFIELAAAQGLQYLADTSIPSMYLGNMPPQVAEKLKVVNNIVRTEQYIDFITNRRFRSTLLCHNNVKLNRALDNNNIKNFKMTLNIKPEKKISEVDLTNGENLKFFLNNNPETNVSSTSPALKAILCVFSENLNNPLSFDEVISKACQKLPDNMQATAEQELISNGMNLVIKGYINLFLTSGSKTKTNTSKPKFSKLAIYQATKTDNNWITNYLHNPVGINAFEKFIIQYMDGNHDKEQIISLMLGQVREGKLTMNKDSKIVEDENEIKMELNSLYDNFIEKCSDLALFV